MTESADIEPVASTSSIPDESDVQESMPSTAPSLTSVTPVTPPVPVPEPQPVSQPKIVPAVPEAPVAPTVPAVPTIPEVPAIPNVLNSYSPCDAARSSGRGIWPWPQLMNGMIQRFERCFEMPWNRQRQAILRSLTCVHSRTHLGSQIDLIFHIGVLLKKYGQEDVMRRMIRSNAAPNSPDVAKGYNIAFLRHKRRRQMGVMCDQLPTSIAMTICD